MNFSEQLHRELGGVGITGRLRRRIAAEYEDHLACDPEAKLGEPQALARQFADELGTARALRAGLLTFAALALAGILFAAAFVTSPAAAFGAAPRGASGFGQLGTAIAIFGSQVAFVAGVLAALRAFHRRRTAVMPAAEAAILVRRAAVGAVFGLATMIGLGVMAIAYRHHLPGSWDTFAEIAAAAGVLGLLASGAPLAAAMRIRPVSPGPAGDIFTDIGAWTPAALRGRPWRFALVTAVAVAVAITLAGVVTDDPFDGALRGILDGVACLGGFAVLGPFLGLWSPRRGAAVDPAG